ncbi:hypothetical protein AKJ65_08125 [candidate division MSBL1 archaeon SCGC-AAA259E19]|uniref:Phenylalanine--tRNA ligase beta subunit n=2 Tax=candidate division MSBL1 TaxID=215777 RepID=A0A133V458_9EURY|nr:hypothetical protein AKJ65_08125 [candidate division MSBL1 archaeon SCGC-AAA259E19]KXB01211.1 hypothetical protein AKJ41_02355 [candidate division MSBL1 archaeon SCGC-AAA259O05]
MPTITVGLSDLNRLLGEDYTLEELRRPLQELGIEVEGMTEEGLKLEVHHNRPDLLGVEGVARSLKGYLEIETGKPDYELGDPKIRLEVDPSIEGTRPVAVMGHIENAEFDDDSLKALMDLQEKLHQILGRDRQKISIGAYDLEGMEMPIRYTTTPPDGEGFIPLEFDEKLSPEEILEEHPKGRRYSHLLEDCDRYPLLVDSEGEVLSMPPVINSEPRKVTVDSENIGLDVTGIDERVARQALRVIMCTVAERGFDIRAVDVEYPDRKFRTPSLDGEERSFNLDRANRELGLDLSSREACGLIKRMRYDVLGEEDGNIRVKVPPYRSDLMHEVDLFEDLAVGYGYNDLEPYLPDLETSGEPHPRKEIGRKARRVLTGFGFVEVMPFMLTSRELNFNLMRTEGEAVTVENPVSEEYSIVRTWLLPGLMEVLRENKQHELPQRIFEVDEVLELDEEAETGARNVLRAAGAVIGEDANFSYARAVAEALFRELRVDWTVEPYDHPSFLNKRAAEFLVDGESWGLVGEMHPEVILNFELEHPVSAFEVNLPR